MLDQKKFGERLCEHRKALDLTQDDIADKIGVSAQAVSKWENGECLPDCYNLKQLGDIFGISLDVLLDTNIGNDIYSVSRKIKQLATEYVWANMTRTGNHKELSDDLWEMWKAVYFVEVGDRELQESDMKQGCTRITGMYGSKVWDDNGGIACVIKSDIKDKLIKVSDAEIDLISTLVSKEYISLIRCLDCCRPISKKALMQATGYDAAKINGMLVYLTENKLIEFFTSNDALLEGYKLTGMRGIIGYMIIALYFLLTEKEFTVSEFLLN